MSQVWFWGGKSNNYSPIWGVDQKINYKEGKEKKKCIFSFYYCQSEILPHNFPRKSDENKKEHYYYSNDVYDVCDSFLP